MVVKRIARRRAVGPELYRRAVTRRLTAGLVLAGLVAAAVGGCTSSPAADPGARRPVATVRVDDVDALPVRSRKWTAGYSRDVFGPSWTPGVDAGGGCDTRDVVLARDLVDVEREGGCTVTRGTLTNPYTGQHVWFVRGPATSPAVQIDHLVSLADAWSAGASGWTAHQRERFANDPAELLAVDERSNQAKSEHTADEWLPRSPTGRCRMVTAQVAVKTRYRLTVTRSEQAAMRRVLAGCT